MRSSLVFIFIFLFVSAHAQLIDSIRNSFNYTPRPLVSLETRNAFITNQLVKVWSLKLGLSFNKTTKVGFSYNWIRDGVESSFDSTKFVKLNYGSGFIEYVFYSDKRFSFSIPVKLGVGNAFYKTTEGSKVNSDWVIIYEPAMQAEMKLLRYFGIGAGVGFRALLKNNKALQEQLNSPIYTVELKFYFDQIISDIKSHK